MTNFTTPTLEMNVILSQAYDQFNTELQKMLDAVAPKKTINKLINQKVMVQQIYQATKERSEK